ncbi:hypothetical protein ASPACDRAFT_1879516 [Aspergillus aculeatus ATCC 16872]|uniref:FMN hydroxy acid dehydrogenase domain-containing protein n=1 Tax=Aspergillus aculeatus (strain ATCC 16872 / CBS 172.66 / WB 5094) TaxID=690307 RepID=A0A1L9X0R2_ASPA1|nr:uncharacterized protein ASPACDRAFT_1879516 [Aspergillus aculeatus ATCC 16872]OJK02080.1 hypothetical protein ASPACDRAFT_1879516 [Aspergillus aculeatus ATCC 16872]
MPALLSFHGHLSPNVFQTYGNYQSEIYSQGVTSGVTPAVTMDPRQLDKQDFAEACRKIGVPYTLSTVSSSSTETGEGQCRRQEMVLYWPMKDDIIISSLTRAKDNGFGVLIITLYTWSLAWRSADLDNVYIPLIKGIGNEIEFTDPAFHNIMGASRPWSSQIFSGTPHTWDQLNSLGKNWDGPLLLKGNQHVDGAKLAVEAGCGDIVVANHGDSIRQVDVAIGSLEVLPEVVDVVGDKLIVLFDSKIRTSADVIKALRLGAKQFLNGRPVIYGLSINGKKKVIRGLLADVWQNMGLTGIRSVTECYRDRFRKVVYPGNRHATI